MADGSNEPVLVSLSAPSRRSLTDGLVRAVAPGAARVLDLDTASESEIADFLAEIAHTDGGFVARVGVDQPSSPQPAERALAIIAATAAALCGDDIRTALRSPDIAFLTSLKPPAIEAVRTVLLAIETDEPTELAAGLAILDPR
ncbi:hypothetical protein [Nocardia arthritidis]|uniref:Uncharacterized protein n=1 Tax=Nocardia arthritidis TaxID=228602 RepID=A0A6G9Y4B4_9NOCA|nr:hypothetical protein [Nocardia arthritidis]QIS08042.1 hypothetical protein F5544_00545 [Nocardia arthritidis]